MRSRTAVVWGFVAVLVLPGCLGGEDAPASDPARPTIVVGDAVGPNDPSEPSLLASAGPVAAPEWMVGDSWTYEASYVSRPGSTSTVTLVVAALQGQDAILAVTDPDAAHAAMFAHWPPMDKVRVKDLGVTVHGTTFGLVRFPLEDGSSWTTDVRGEQVAFRAVRVPGLDASLPPKFLVTGMGADSPRFTFVYDAAIGWFERFDYWFPGNTDPSHSFVLQGFQRGFQGEATRLTWTDAYVGHRFGEVPPAAPEAPADTFTVPPEASYVLAGVFHGGGPGAVGAAIGAAQGDVYTVGGPRTAEEPIVLAFSVLPNAPGEWGIEFSTASQSAFVFAEVLAVTETPVTIAPTPP